MPTECHRCRLLESEAWRLAQRQQELERRLQHLTVAVERLTHVVQALRRETSPAPDVRVRPGAGIHKGDLPQ
jgi:hypothetical protein